MPRVSVVGGLQGRREALAHEVLSTRSAPGRRGSTWSESVSDAADGHGRIGEPDRAVPILTSPTPFSSLHRPPM